MEVYIDDITVYGGVLKNALLILKSSCIGVLIKIWCLTGKSALL